jgi:hypothetical protein
MALPPAQGRGQIGNESLDPLSDHPKTPAQSPAHATIRRMETGSRKARHKALHLGGVGLVALGLCLPSR